MSVERTVGEEKEVRLTPDRELFTEDGYRWLRYDKEQTFLPLISLENLETETLVTTTIAAEDRRVAALRAWSGARHSRAPGTSSEIMHEMVEKEVDADQKLEQLFVNYGHSSVADMAQLYAHIERVPMHFCMTSFNMLSLNSGQEKSTRYQVEFEEMPLHDLRNYVTGLPEEEILALSAGYQGVGRYAQVLFSKHKRMVEEEFQKKFSPQSKRERNSLVSRGLDTSRAFLLMGQLTGQYIGESARNWSRMIGDLKASPIPFYRRVAGDLERLFVPSEEEERKLNYKAEAPGLVRHTEENTQTNENLKTLRYYLENLGVPGKEFSIRRLFRGEVDQKVELVDRKLSSAERAIAQYIVTLWPGADEKEVFDWVEKQPGHLKEQLGRIVLNGHSHHSELPNLMCTSDITLIMKGSIAEVRDFNRHRAWGRFIEIPLLYGLPMDFDTARQILANGYVLPSYLTEVEEFGELRGEFVKNLTSYYERLYDLLGAAKERYGRAIDYGFVVNLLPLSHQVDLWMHGDPKQSLYMPHLRARPGGQINYRIMAWRASRLIAESNPYLSPLEIKKRPNPGDRSEFFDRS